MQMCIFCPSIGKWRQKQIAAAVKIRQIKKRFTLELGGMDERDSSVEIRDVRILGQSQTQGS